VLVEVGLLALVATGAVVVRETDEGRARSNAVSIAVDRLELSALRPCADAAGEADAPHAMREHWRSALIPISAREITDSVTYRVAAGERQVVLRTRTQC